MSELGISSVGGFMCCALCCLAYIGCLAPFYVAKQKLWPNFVASKASGQGQGKQGAGEGACNKWDICQLLLLLPSMLLPLLLLSSSMLLAAIKTRKNVYFAKAPSFFCLFLAAPSPITPPPFPTPLLVVVLFAFRLFAFWLGLLPPVQVVLCVNRHKYMCT